MLSIVSLSSEPAFPLQVDEVFRYLSQAELSEILIVSGLVFLFVAVAGNVSGRLEPGRTGRIAGGVVGMVLLTSGLILGLPQGPPVSNDIPPVVTETAEAGDDVIRTLDETTEAESGPTQTDTATETASSEHEVAVVSMSPSSPATLDVGDRVTVGLRYETTAEDGVRIWAIPVSDSSDYAYAASQILPTGSGEVERFFYFDAEASISEFRIRMIEAGTRRTLYETTVPVSYEWAEADHGVTVTSVRPSSPATLDVGDRVTVDLEYETTAEDGVRIWVTPVTDSRDYAYAPSGVLSTGSGEAQRYFYFTAEASITGMRVHMVDAESRRTLYETTVPVSYEWAETDHRASIVSSNPRSPATLDVGDRVTIDLEYETTAEDGVRLWVIPVSDNTDYAFAPSGVLPAGSGEAERFFYFSSETRLTEVRILMIDAETRETLYETTVPVEYRWTR